MATNRDCLWFKPYGGDHGAMRRSRGRRWVWYDCLHCARFDNPEVFSTPRWQGPPSEAIVKAMKRAYNGEAIRCKGADYHKKIREAKI